MLLNVPKDILSKESNICNEDGHLQNAYLCVKGQNSIIRLSYFPGILDPGVPGSHEMDSFLDPQSQLYCTRFIIHACFF